jgi:hypothetical protein
MRPLALHALRRPCPLVLLAALVVAPVRVTGAQRTAPGSDWAAVDRALGRTGASLPGGIHKYAFPRSDLHVVASGVEIKPALALGSWIAFEPTGDGQVIAMGDLVLTEDEIDGVMRALQRGGVEQTAVHNHVLHESPRVMYMHVRAHGAPVKIAETIHAALATSHTPLDAPGAPAAAAAIDLDTAAVHAALGVAGSVNGGVYQVSVPRREAVRMEGHDVPPPMGVATAINFQPTGGGKAAITGDFVMRADEVNPVIRALTEAGIAVTALHSHMLDEEPRLFFMHFWANDDAKTLARGLGDALGHMAVKRAGSR